MGCGLSLLALLDFLTFESRCLTQASSETFSGLILNSKFGTVSSLLSAILVDGNFFRMMYF